MTATGVVTALLTLPLLPLPTIDRSIAATLGWIVPPMALTHDLHGEFGWESHVAAVNRVLDALPAGERADVAILAGSYAQAGALNVLRLPAEPRAVSGHMSYFLWGPGERSHARTVLAYGLPRSWLSEQCAELSEVGRIDAPLARPLDTNLPIWLCRGPTRPLGELWPGLKRFHHRRE
jgi:hypothetical protein